MRWEVEEDRRTDDRGSSRIEQSYLLFVGAIAVSRVSSPRGGFNVDGFQFAQTALCMLIGFVAHKGAYVLGAILALISALALAIGLVSRVVAFPLLAPTLSANHHLA